MTHDVERVLADIDADHGDRCVEFLRHGVLLVLSAPCQLLILAGPEHGRTIPLADSRPKTHRKPRGHGKRRADTGQANGPSQAGEKLPENPAACKATEKTA